jgi:hypothetical protein
VPAEVRRGALETVKQALNELNRENKRIKFAFESSEDAVTWTVFRYLQDSQHFRSTLQHLHIKSAMDTSTEPTLLLWGVPVPLDNSPGWDIQRRLVEVSNRIGEKPRRRSEPDVILDFGDAGLVFVEVKYRSRNEFVRESYPHFRTYLKETDAFVDAGVVRHSGRYELARNWRIGWELAKLTGSQSFTLMNLGPAGLFEDKKERQHLVMFRSGLFSDQEHQFLTATWPAFLGGIPGPWPRWFEDYVNCRGLMERGRGICIR